MGIECRRLGCGATGLLIAGLLAGCVAPTRPYVEPRGVPTARLLTRGAVTGNDLYGVFVFEDAERCLDSRIAGAGSPARAPKATSLVGGKLTTVDFYVSRTGTNQFCRVRWSFRPVAGNTYLLAGGMVDDRCYARVLDATDPDKIQPEASARRRNVGAQLCVALADAPPLQSSLAVETATGEAVLRPGASSNDLQGLIKP